MKGVRAIRLLRQLREKGTWPCASSLQWKVHLHCGCRNTAEARARQRSLEMVLQPTHQLDHQAGARAATPKLETRFRTLQLWITRLHKDHIKNTDWLPRCRTIRMALAIAHVLPLGLLAASSRSFLYLKLCLEVVLVVPLAPGGSTQIRSLIPLEKKLPHLPGLSLPKSATGSLDQMAPPSAPMALSVLVFFAASLPMKAFLPKRCRLQFNCL